MNGGSESRRRQQRRRAIVAWTTAAIVVALFAVGAIFGGGDEDRGNEVHGAFGYTMTSDQYDGLHKGEAENDVLDRVEGSGLPEYLVVGDYRDIFPSHPDDVLCSFWEISDRFGYVARVCFSDPGGRLVQKLQRNASGEEFGVSA